MTRMLKKALENVLSDKDSKDLVSAFDQIGDIIIVRIPDSLISKKKVIGKALLEQVKTAKSVFHQSSPVEGDFRTRNLELLEGEEKTETEYRENGCRFIVDVEKAFFSPRLSTERERISNIVNENDVMLASAADAVVIGVQSQIEQGAIRQSRSNNIVIKNYNIVYEMIDDLTEMILENKKSETEEKVHGIAEILDTFSVGKTKVAGGFRVVEGSIKRNGLVKITRRDELIHQGSISSLRHLKENVREIKSGMEGGITLDGFNDYEIGDIVECFEIVTN